MKNVHPLRTARRQIQRTNHPVKPRCVFCIDREHVAGRNHDFALTFQGIYQKHHDHLTKARRDAGISMEFERNRVKRVALALKSVSEFFHMLADAMWRWAEVLEDEEGLSAVSPALSPDGRMLAFIRGPSTFLSPGQIYVKLLPDGEPVQLTHDNLTKMSPQFSPDGSRIVYTVVPSTWDTWVVPVLGGEPRLMLPNAEGLIWIDG